MDVGSAAMRRRTELSDRAVRAASIGMHHDGAGLYLQVSQGRTGINRSWLFRFVVGKKSRYMGLGPFPMVSLAQAREKAANARKQLSEGVDPIAHKRAVRASLSQRQATEQAVTFDDCVTRYLQSHAGTWRRPQHVQQWTNTLATYVRPHIGFMPAADVDTPAVLRVLTPIWNAKPQTAAKLRGRLEMILDFAHAHGYRAGENPARWRVLSKALPRPSKVRAVRHYAALPYQGIPGFFTELREREITSTSQCLMFLILTAARGGEARHMKWTELDLQSKLWTVPASKMKAGREHRVPLSAAAIELLEGLPRAGEYVFPGARRSQLSHAAMPALLVRMGHFEITPHGFRSSFSTWAREQTSFQREVIEAALAHTVGDPTERAYARGDALEKRRALMNAWADYCGRGHLSAEVIRLRA
jgi:integrase